MANGNNLEIEFLDPFVSGNQIIINTNLRNITHTWVPERTGGLQVTTQPTVELTLEAYRQAMNGDFPLYITAIVSSSKITFKTKNTNEYFINAEIVGNSRANINLYNTGFFLYIAGIEGNNYYINNDILATLYVSDTVTGYFTIKLTNLSNGSVATNNITAQQGLDGRATVNLSPLIKGIFRNPVRSGTLFFSNARGIDLIKIDISHSNGAVERVLRKNFIRGGIRGNKTNINAVTGSLLYPTAKIPYWNGFISRFSYLNANGSITLLQSNSPIITGNPANLARLDLRRVSSCNNAYFQFQNQYGGVSYWLFENYSLSDSNNNLGGFVEYNNNPSGSFNIPNEYKDYTDLADLGNTAAYSMVASSKVPAEYIDLIRDLIISPEIYLIKNGEYIRVFSGKNTIVSDPSSRAFNVKININFNYRFNPALIW